MEQESADASIADDNLLFECSADEVQYGAFDKAGESGEERETQMEIPGRQDEPQGIYGLSDNHSEEQQAMETAAGSNNRRARLSPLRRLLHGRHGDLLYGI